LVEIALAESAKVRAVVSDEPDEVVGINTQWDLAQAERLLQKKRVKELALKGARIADPDRLDIRGDVQVGKDCFIDVNVVLEGSVFLGDRSSIGPGSVVIDSKLGDGTKILAHSVVEGAQIGSNCSIGPFARVRLGTIVEEGAKIGNFVETKKARLGRGSKASHLAYLGDADIGADCNIGAGTVTCNYDGIQKNETQIGDGVFVGTNSTLVAPINIGKDSFIAAGSTITSTVKESDLAVGRAKQRNIEGWLPPSKRK
jgi:bifunctional UDP-N-acetylglucosamine pyrophosphorylase/glucosamine-1-phosphate N-acetyltransferase